MTAIAADMPTLIKKVITQVTFRENLSDKDDIRYLRLRYESEGAGRYFVLTDESEGKGNEIILSSPEDFKMLYEAALEMWAQGSIYCEGGGW